jgi:hypothetical protein
MKTTYFTTLLALALCLLLAACTGGGAPQQAAAPTAQPAPTDTPVPPPNTPVPPTNTPVPPSAQPPTGTATPTPAPTDTPTPKPTDTPQPSDTPAPTATPTLPPTDTPLPTKAAATSQPSPTPTPVGGAAQQHLEQGLVYAKQSQWDQAIAEFEKAVELDATFGPTYMLLGYSYASKGETAKAIQALEKYLELEPGADDAAQVRADIDALKSMQAEVGVCCPPLTPGKGLFWFDNHVGQEIQLDFGTNLYKIAAKQNDVPGCLCLELDPGHHQFILSGFGIVTKHQDIDIVEGEILHWPLSLRQ